MATAPWLEVAWKLYGEKEIAGARDNPKIVSWSQRMGHSWVTNDEVPWCAAYVGHALTAAGYTSSGSLRARSYLDWGTRLEVPEAKGLRARKAGAGLPIGSVAVLSRGRNPAQGHVGFLVDLDGAKITLLGGNQGNAVSIARYARSRLLGLRWPATDAPPRTGSACPIFRAALQHVLSMEGGCVDDPADPGGYTCKGVTEKNFRSWRRGIGKRWGKLTGMSSMQVRSAMRGMGQDEIAEFYFERYWRPASCQKLPHGLALFHFDCGVNQGVSRARKFLQRALGVAVDGEIGPITLSTAFKKREDNLLGRYASIRRDHYRGLPHFWRFGKGWLRRVERTLRRALMVSKMNKGQKNMTDTAAQTGASTKPSIAATPTAKTTQPSAAPKERDNPNSAQPGKKWWAHSKTIWGALIAAAATVLPLLAPLVGVDVTASDVKAFGTRVDQLLQILAGLTGTALTIWGRLTARASLTTREVRVRV